MLLGERNSRSLVCSLSGRATFVNFRDLKKLQNLTDAKNKSRERNLMRKLSDTSGKHQERLSLVY